VTDENPSARARLAAVLVPALVLPAVLLGIGAAVGLEVDGKTHWSVPLAVIAALVWTAAYVAELQEGGGENPLYTRLLVGVAVAAFGLNTLPDLPRALQGEHVRTWNQFHYYLGAKYLEEVGWHDLYPAVLLADERRQEAKAAATPLERAAMEAVPDFGHARQARSMTTYKIEPREVALEAYDASAWSPERLDELGRDSRWLRARAKDDNWARRWTLDYGFNPAPPWTIFGTTLANAVPLGSAAYGFITTSDFAVHVLAILAMWWAFGLRAGALTAIWIHTSPLNGRLVIGGFLNYDWLGATVLGVAAYRKERPVLSGLALAYAGMTRVFPGVLILPVVGRWAWNVARRRPTLPLRRTFSMVFIAGCAVLFVGSHFTGRGLDTWPDWQEKISKHSSLHATSGARRVGLGRLVRHAPKQHRFWRAQKLRSAEKERTRETVKHVAMAAGLALLLVALRRRTDVEAMLLMLFAVWLISVSSRYYASVWVLLFALPTHVSGARAPPGAVATWGLLLLGAVFYAPGGAVAQYLFFNYGALALFVGLCVAFVLQDRRTSTESVSPSP